MSLTIRTAVLADLPHLEPVMKASVLGLSGDFYGAEQVASAATYIAVPDPDIVRDGTYYVVEDDGRVVGCGGWSRLRKLFTGTTDQEGLGLDHLDPASEPARIRAMFVLPDAARRGIGRLIYDACEKAARDGGFRELELMGTLPGVPFYRTVGFVDVEKCDLILPDGVRLPCIRMGKTLV